MSKDLELQRTTTFKKMVNVWCSLFTLCPCFVMDTISPWLFESASTFLAIDFVLLSCGFGCMLLTWWLMSWMAISPVAIFLTSRYVIVLVLLKVAISCLSFSWGLLGNSLCFREMVQRCFVVVAKRCFYEAEQLHLTVSSSRIVHCWAFVSPWCL